MFYTHFHLKKDNTIFLRFINHNKQRKTITIDDFKPTFFIKTKSETKYRALDGTCLKPIETKSIREAKKILSEYADVKGLELYGDSNFEYSLIGRLWKDQIEYDESLIKVYYLDIETAIHDRFPDPHLAGEPILIITIFDSISKKFICWTTKNASPKSTFPIELRVFRNEDLMLNDFIQYWRQDYPDVITGWNTEGFDILYLINRIKQRFGEDKAKSLSPVNAILEDHNSKSYEIKGIEHLDYLQLVKKFIPGDRDFSLDAIAQEFLNKNKLKNPYSSFKEFYQKAWELFVEYNINDTLLVYELNQKLKLLSLVFSLAYLTKVNYSDTLGTVKQWSTFIKNALAQKNIFVPCSFEVKDTDKQILGGYVMHPKPGKYNWVVSFDANSLYPSIIRSWNISPETILQDHEIPEELLQYHNKIQTDELLQHDTTTLTALLQKYNLTMTANGHFFRRDRKGIMPLLSEAVYNDRVAIKNELKHLKQKLVEISDQEEKKILEDKIYVLDNKQLALKILLNSLYGAMANPYFQFFDHRCAEGITATGQYFVQKVGQFTSAYIDKISGKNDSLIYMDTDSNYFSLQSLLEKANFTSAPINKTLDVIEKFCNEKIEKKIKEVCDIVGQTFNVFENHLEFKNEKICESGIFVAKKRYALCVWNSEGVRYKEPVILTTGLETKRSNIPKFFRGLLDQALRIMLLGKEDELIKFVDHIRKTFQQEDLFTIAIPSNVNGLDKYAHPKTIYKQGCPQHVRASLLYNHFLKVHKIEDKYAPILEGSKIRKVFLKLPNPIKEDVIGFVDKLPKEFGLTNYIDYDRLFQKAFLDALERMVDAVGWNISKQASLDLFFN